MVLRRARISQFMAEDSDADFVRRERERRRGEARDRMERDRRERELELARLRRSDLLLTTETRHSEGIGEARVPEPAPEPAPMRVAPLEQAPRPPPRREAPRSTPPRQAPSSGPQRASASTSRAIGRAIHSPALQQLLAIDPTEKFDIILLNALRFPGVVEEASSDPRLLESLRERTETLMSRVKAEEDDALSAGAFLREQVLFWYRTSPTDPDWAAHMPLRWAGLFADSRVMGGKLHPWLNHRLMALYEGSVKQGKLGSRIRSGLSRSRPVDAAVNRAPHQLIQAQAAQALLDDLAAAPRDGEKPFPLVRLSELAVRREVQTVNDSLSILFSSHETGPFIILHPNRYPDCNELQIRPPLSGAKGAALAFLLASPRQAKRGRGGAGSSGAEGGAEGAGEGEGFEDGSVWESPSVTAETWKATVDEVRQERKRLDAPPKDYRTRPAYAALRDILLEDAEFRKAFLAAKWRGRPAGIPLLVTLLQKGTLSPEVATDYEYLEAELGALAADDPDWRPEGGKWTFHNWTVIREAEPNGAVRYRAERSAEPPPPPPPPP